MCGAPWSWEPGTGAAARRRPAPGFKLEFGRRPCCGRPVPPPPPHPALGFQLAPGRGLAGALRSRAPLHPTLDGGSGASPCGPQHPSVARGSAQGPPGVGVRVPPPPTRHLAGPTGLGGRGRATSASPPAPGVGVRVGEPGAPHHPRSGRNFLVGLLLSAEGRPGRAQRTDAGAAEGANLMGDEMQLLRTPAPRPPRGARPAVTSPGWAQGSA